MDYVDTLTLPTALELLKEIKELPPVEFYYRAQVEARKKDGDKEWRQFLSERPAKKGKRDQGIKGK